MNIRGQEITHRTRPSSVDVFSDAAREQVAITVAALAHHEQDNDSVSQIRASEAVAALSRIARLDEAIVQLDKQTTLLLDSSRKAQDTLLKL